MKSFLKISAYLACTILLASCSSEDSIVDQTPKQSELDLKDLDLDLSTLKISGSDIVLFNYSSAKDAAGKIEKSLSDLDEEITAVMATDKSINNTEYIIDFKNNRATLRRLTFLNSNSETIISQPVTSSTYPLFDWGPILYGSCPQGWTDQGSYSDKKVIADVSRTLLSNALQGSGDCIQLQYSRGLLSVKLCSKSC